MRVAQVIGKLANGGVEAVVNNYYRHTDTERFQFDYFKGNGFCAQDVVSAMPVPQVDGRNMYRFCFPQEVYTVRFDPVEGTGCLLTRFEARSHILPERWLSNGIQTSRAIVFRDEDPQIRIDFDEGIRELIVYAGVERINLGKGEEPA